jgi:C-terminal processing protease CtpA/Prc
MTIPQEARERILTKVQETVQAGYYAPDFHGKHWNEIVASHRQTIVDATTAERFEQEMNTMLADLDSNMRLLGPNSKITARNAINASFHAVDLRGDGGRRWVFQDVASGGVAQRCGVQPADVLLTIDGAPAAPPDRPAFEMDRATRVEILRGNERKQIDLDLRTPAPKYKDNPYSEPSLTGTMTPDRIAIVKISLFPGKIGIDFANALSHLFRDRLAGAEGLVLDLRGNPGGGIGNLRLMSLFTPTRQPVGYSLDRATAENGTLKERLPRLGKIPSQKWELIPLAVRLGTKKSVVLETEGLGPQPFHGRIVILVNEHTTGAAEMVTLFAKENSLATIVGTETPGRLISRTGTKVGAGYQLVFPVAAYQSWNGTRIEGLGIETDIRVPWSFEDAQRGEDTQLDRALEVLHTR